MFGVHGLHIYTAPALSGPTNIMVSMEINKICIYIYIYIYIYIQIYIHIHIYICTNICRILLLSKLVGYGAYSYPTKKPYPTLTAGLHIYIYIYM